LLDAYGDSAAHVACHHYASAHPTHSRSMAYSTDSNTLGAPTGRGLVRDRGATRRPVALVRRRKNTVRPTGQIHVALRGRIARQRSDAQPRTEGAYGSGAAALRGKTLEKVAQHGCLRLMDVVFRRKAL